MEERPPPLAPIDPSAPYALRMMLIRRYWYLTLKFSNPFISESGRHEASWNGGEAVADTEAELMVKVLELLEDCGDEGHLWVTASEKRDPVNSENLLMTQLCHTASRNSTFTPVDVSPEAPTESADGARPSSRDGPIAQLLQDVSVSAVRHVMRPDSRRCTYFQSGYDPRGIADHDPTRQAYATR